MKTDSPPRRARPLVSRGFKWALAVMLVGVLVAAYFLLPWLRTRLARRVQLGEWFLNRHLHADWMVHAGERCGDAPFVLPTDGYIGFIWGDSFQPGHKHQGLDIFGGQEEGLTPVVAAFSGYLTRLPEWRSAVILRLPRDPLQPERQIWLYYAHMADRSGSSFIAAQYPPGSEEIFVEAGTLLGYQGNYSGDPFNPTGVHLHFSIVLDDGQGGFLSELEFANTLDPSTYLGLPLNASTNTSTVPVCAQGSQPPGNQSGVKE